MDKKKKDLDKWLENIEELNQKAVNFLMKKYPEYGIHFGDTWYDEEKKRYYINYEVSSCLYIDNKGKISLLD